MKKFIAPFLSFLICGLGQFYNGQIKKAIFYIIGSFVFLCIFLISIFLFYKIFINLISGNSNTKLIFIAVILFTFSSFMLSLINLLSIVDAYISAK
ncbi:MAG: hypothetical protein QXZ20_03655 [Candidatus Aenigmatarchaeota archaeon]